nr:uncharacterized protein LOC108123940 [Drosophila bipectinata]
MATQTSNQNLPECSCQRPKSQVKNDASTQSVVSKQAKKNVSTQSVKNLKNAQTQSHQNHTASSQNSKTEKNGVKPTKEKGTSRKCFWKHPIIVVNRDSSSKVLQSESTRNGRGKSAIKIKTRDNQTQYEIPSNGARSERNSSLSSFLPEIIDRVDQLESQLRRQERSLRTLEGSVRSWKVQESKPADCRILFQSNPNDFQTPQKKSIEEKSTQSTERCLTAQEITAAQKKPLTSDQSTQKNDNASSDDKTLSQEFLEIFMLPKTKSPKTTLKNRSASETDTQRPTSTRFSQDMEILLKHFDKAFENNSEECISTNTKMPEDDKCHRPISSRSISPSGNSSKEKELENLIEKFGQLVSKLKNDSIATQTKDSSSSIKRSSSRPSCSRNDLPKRDYKPFIQQLAQLFAKSQAPESKPTPTSVEPKSGSLDRFMAELTRFFSKQSEQESKPSTIKEQNPKMVTIISKEETLAPNSKLKSISTQSQVKNPDLDSKDEKNRPCANESKSTFSEVNGSNVSIRAIPQWEPDASRCQCGDGKGAIGDSLIENLMFIIGGRSLKDVVLTIVRQEGNIYHMSVREMDTGLIIGCLLANGIAIREAIALGLFEDIKTFCELDKLKTRDPQECPVGANVLLGNPRERGGEAQLNKKGMCKDGQAFATRVLGLPAEQAARFFSLTNALRLAKNPSEQSIRETDKPEVQFGKGAVTGSMLAINNVDTALVSSGSESNWRQLGASSSLLFPLVSDQEDEKQN